MKSADELCAIYPGVSASVVHHIYNEGFDEGRRRAQQSAQSIAVCDRCRKALGPRAYQAETKTWVATGKFPTFEYCSPECAELGPCYIAYNVQK